MRILVTGGTGFVGRVTIRHALDAGHSVVVTLRSARDVDRVDPRVTPVVAGDIGPRTDWSPALQGVQAIVHLAARAHVLRDASSDPVAEFQRINVDGALHLARLAHSYAVRRFIFVSSAGVGGSISPGRPLREDDEPRPHSPYAKAKWAAEQALHQWSEDSGVECVIVRPTLVYGPGAPGNLRRLLAAIARGLPLPFAGISNARSMMGVDNLASLLLRCLTHDAAPGNTFYAADGVVSTPQLVRTLAEGMGRPARLVQVPTALMRLAAYALGRSSMFEQLWCSLVVDTSRAACTLGWQPTISMQTGLRQSAAGYLRSRSA